MVQISIPDEVQVEMVSSEQIPGWDSEDLSTSRAFGDKWIRDGRSAVLRVPSVITQRREFNIVLNVQHQQFRLIQAGPPEAVHWDARPFSAPGSSPR